LEATQLLKFDCTPVPVMEMVAGRISRVAGDCNPARNTTGRCGAKVTFKAADCPGARTVPEDTLLVLKPAPVAPTLEMVTLAEPEFFSVTPSVLLPLVSMFRSSSSSDLQ